MEFVGILRDQAFRSLDITGHTVDVQGWMDDAFPAVVSRALDARDPNLPLRIVEVGSWKGLSTSTMARICRERGFHDACIICVDTWLGAPEFWTWGRTDPTRGVSLNLSHGWPTVFYTFTKNMKALGFDSCVAPFPISSVQGAAVLASQGVAADVIYVDASHEYEAVMLDLEAYYPLLKQGGTMIGDDFCCNWPGVMRAVNEFAAEHGLHVTVDGVVWSFVKP